MKFKSAIKVARPLLTLLEYAVSVLIISVTAQIVFGNNLQTWIITAISVVLATTTYAIWYSDGVERAEKTAKVFNTTLRYNTYAKKIRELQVTDKQKQFCEMKNQQYAQELLIDKLNDLELSIDDLKNYTTKLQNARIKAKIKPKWTIGKIAIGKVKEYPEDFVDFCKQFNKAQLKTMLWLTSHRIKFDKITPDDLTKATVKRKGIKPKNTEHKKLPITLISKVVWGVMLGLLTAYIIFANKGVWTMNETIQVLTWAFSISYNIYTSIVAGYKSVSVDRYNYYIEKIELTTEFFGFIEKPMDEIESTLADKLIQDN